MTGEEKLAVAAAMYPELTELKIVGPDVHGINGKGQLTIVQAETLAGYTPPEVPEAPAAAAAPPVPPPPVPPPKKAKAESEAAP